MLPFNAGEAVSLSHRIGTILSLFFFKHTLLQIRRLVTFFLRSRLHHEIFKNTNKPPNHGGPKAYHTLQCFDIDSTSNIKKPDLSLATMDHFSSSIAGKGPAGLP